MDAARRTLFILVGCPSSVATHLPVATFHTLSVFPPLPSYDPDTTCCPSGNNATHSTYNEDTLSGKYYKKRTQRAAHDYVH